MSWSARRRFLYLTAVFVFFVVVIGGPILYHELSIPPTCHDGIQNQGETAIDEGGPCLLLNAAELQPEGVLWARAFNVRQGLYDAVAYVDNPNKSAGVLDAPYELILYDDQNALVADVKGDAFIMPGGPTPIFIGGIQTGNRIAVHAEFQFTSPLTWEKVVNVQQGITITNQEIAQAASSSEISAVATNVSISPITNVTFVATVFDPSGNAIATSQTALQKISSGESQQIFFTWPSRFSAPVGRVDIIPAIAPQIDTAAKQ